MLSQILFSILGLVALLTLPVQAQPKAFQGWVSYQGLPLPSDVVSSKLTDTLFIAGPDSAVHKRMSTSRYYDFPVVKQITSFTIYGQRTRRFSYLHHTRLDRSISEPTLLEGIFLDSLERARWAKRTVEIIPLDSTKSILGYPCRLALVKTRHTYFGEPREASVMVFYTDQLPNVTDEYDGLPGLPLETWTPTDRPRPDGKLHNHRWATNIVAGGMFPWAYFEPRKVSDNIVKKLPPIKYSQSYLKRLKWPAPLRPPGPAQANSLGTGHEAGQALVVGRAGGRPIATGCVVAGQSGIARWLAGQAGYRRLAVDQPSPTHLRAVACGLLSPARGGGHCVS